MPFLNNNTLRGELRYNYLNESKSGETLDSYAERKLAEQARNFNPSETYDIFLSHSVKDAAVVLRIMKILESQGLTVYVDWVVDKNLDRSEVTPETARIIRDRLKASRSMLLILTSSSANSSWVQWELGLGDGQKNGKVAIVPVLTGNETNQNFHRQEYLGLYPYIDFGSEHIFVKASGIMFLKDWLSRADPLKQILYS